MARIAEAPGLTRGSVGRKRAISAHPEGSLKPEKVLPLTSAMVVRFGYPLPMGFC